MYKRQLVDYVFSTSAKGRDPHRDSVRLRRKAVELSIPCITAVDLSLIHIYSFFLIPGYGAQGGKAEDIAQYLTQGNGGVVNSSRGILLAGYEYGVNYLGAPVLGPLVWCVVCIALNTLLDWLYQKSGSIWVPSLAHGAFKMCIRDRHPPAGLQT